MTKIISVLNFLMQTDSQVDEGLWIAGILIIVLVFLAIWASFDSSKKEITKSENKINPKNYGSVVKENNTIIESNSYSNDLNNNLNNSQNKAANYIGKHLLVLAGAGTGKTKTIIARAQVLISKGIDPSSILILTFTKKASAEIVTRVSKDINSKKRVVGSTFHGWCNMILHRYKKYFKSNEYTVIDRDDQESIVKLISGKYPDALKKLKMKSRKIVDIYSYGRNTKQNLTESISKKVFDKKYSDLNKENSKIIDELRILLSKILEGYEKKKYQRKYLDYDDLIILVSDRLQKDEKFLQIIGKKYTNILVDEMQDTNPIQWDLLKSLSKVSNLFCVGDDAQSIYSFRGADFNNIHSFKEKLPNSEIYKLEKNYRSSQQILDISNWLLEKSKIPYNKRLVAVKGFGNKPIFLKSNDNWEESEWICKDILSNYSTNNKKFKDHLVLARTQFATRTIEATFLTKKIPYVVFGGRKFMESAHIKDLISLLRTVHNKNDEIAWIRFLTLWPGLGNVTATRTVDLILNSNNPTVEILNSLNITGNKIKLGNVYKDVQKLKTKPKEATQLLYSKLEKLLANKYDDWDRKRKRDFSVLIDLSEQFSSIGEFISSLIIENPNNMNSILSSLEDLKKVSEKDYVIISTIHSAKGLEADMVYILDVNPGSYPSSYSIGNDDDIEEERRLLYVAMTRAKEYLYVCNDLYSQSSSQNELYFLNGIPKNLYESITISSSNNDDGQIDESELSDFEMDIGMDMS